MSKTTQETKISLWKRLFVEPSEAAAHIADPRPVFAVCSILAVAAAILGWVTASLYPGWGVPACSFSSIILGILGVRSKLRSISVVGFVMGMFLLPNAINTIIRLTGS